MRGVLYRGREKAIALTKEISKKGPERSIKGYDLRTPASALEYDI